MALDFCFDSESTAACFVLGVLSHYVATGEVGSTDRLRPFDTPYAG